MASAASRAAVRPTNGSNRNIIQTVAMLARTIGMRITQELRPKSVCAMKRT